MAKYSTKSSDGSEIKIRRLELSDYHKGFIELLDNLSPCGIIEYNNFVDKFNHNPWNNWVFVAEYKGQLIGTVTLLLAPKFKEHNKYLGFVENVVIAKEFQGKGIGKLLMDFISSYVKNLCYELRLKCSESKVVFYEKCGYEKNDVSMRFKLEK